jgi:hypothetical protein
VKSKTELLQTCCEQVWEQGDLEAIDRLLSSDTQADSIIAGEAMGSDDFKILVTVLRELMESLTITLRKIINQDD